MIALSTIAPFIEHTLLKPEATQAAISQLCEEALQYSFAAVCVNPYYISQVRNLLQGSTVRVCSVIGFPLGANRTSSKVNEVIGALADGATELDMVMNIAAAKDGDWRTVEDDIAAVVKAAASQAVVKVIIETALLSEQEKELACLVAQKAGATYVKTSTGFASGGATVADVALMRQTVPQMRIKASGGIRDLAAAISLLQAGANRLGLSASVALMQEEAR